VVTVCRDRADLRNHLSGDWLRHFFDLFRCALNCFVDAALQRHRIRTRGDSFYTLAKDGLRQHRRRGGAVTGNVAGLRRDFAHHLRAHVLHWILELNLFRDGHAIFGNRRAPIFLIENDVAALRAERDFHCVGELIDPAQDCRARFFAMSYLLCHNSFVLIFKSNVR
jgi:hypothetical protein